MSSAFVKTYFLITLLFCSLFSLGQVDTIQLPQDELGLEDIRITADEIARNQVFTASRTLNNVDELPLSIYVVTGEEILRNGYFTLTDVLKNVPGVFVSQPGSAIEGETFVMNGLHGNTHTKILVDNIPVKVNDVLGMPIGSQLPIRQAERIEITYGPSGIIHGTEAGAGVVNIITRKSERPVYTHADLGVGSQGYSSVNVLFGGKLGKNKKILKFNAYGSSTELRSINIFQTGVFVAEVYPLNSFVEQPEILSSYNLFPQTSRQVGINLKYRSFSLSAARMFRRDHVAIGANPLSVNNQNPQTTYGERISTYNLAFKKDFKKFGLKSSIYFVDHEVDRESSIELIQPHLKQLMNFAASEAAGEDVELRDQYISENNALFFEGRRYMTGRSINAKAEQTLSLFPYRNLELIMGANAEFVGGNVFKEYLPESTGSFDGDVYFNFNLFAQAYLTFKKLNLILGVNRYQRGQVSETDDLNRILPRFAGLYKINSKLNIRASYASSFMVPAQFLDKRSGIIQVESMRRPRLFVSPYNEEAVRLNPQQTNYVDLGLRYNVNNKIRFDLTIFNSKNDNLILYKDEFIPTADGFNIEYGYSNFDNHQSKLTGIRASAIFRNVIPSREMDINMHFSYFKGEQDLPSGEKFPHILSQPDYIAQLSLSLRLYKQLYLTIENNYIGPFASRGLETLDQYYFIRNNKYTRLSRLVTDITFNLRLNNNFKIFSKVSNLFTDSGFTEGIDATGTPDDLFYNVQRGPYFQGGVSYTIN